MFLFLSFVSLSAIAEQCERETSRVLVHCMSGKNRCDSSVVSIHVVSIVVNDRLILLWYKISRSAAIVIGYLMKSRGWRLSVLPMGERPATTGATDRWYDPIPNNLFLLSCLKNLCQPLFKLI